MRRMNPIADKKSVHMDPKQALASARRLMKLAHARGLAGRGGMPPLDTSKLRDGATFVDSQLVSRAESFVRTPAMFPEANRQLGARGPLLQRLLDRQSAAWRLYTYSMEILIGGSDIQRITAAAHQLISRRLEAALVAVLEDPSLPADERDDLEMHLDELDMLLKETPAQAQATRDKNRRQRAALEADLESLGAEEKLLKVMMAVKQGQTVAWDDLVEAGETYQEQTAEADDDRRDRTRH